MSEPANLVEGFRDYQCINVINEFSKCSIGLQSSVIGHILP